MSNQIITTKKHLSLSQKFAMVIPVIFILSVTVKSYVERFRASVELRHIYEYGSMISLDISLLSVALSFANSIFILVNLKMKINYKIFWLLLSASPFLYFTIMMTIAMLTNVG
jgi:hypothetical protein